MKYLSLILIFFVPILVFGAVNFSSLTDGQIITKSELDSTDFTSVRQGVSIDSLSLTGGIYLNASSVVIEKEGSEFKGKSVTYKFGVSKDYYNKCRETKTKAECVAEAKQIILAQIISFKDSYSEEYKKYQENDVFSELQAKDFSITQQELDSL